DYVVVSRSVGEAGVGIAGYRRCADLRVRSAADCAAQDVITRGSGAGRPRQADLLIAGGRGQTGGRRGRRYVRRRRSLIGTSALTVGVDRSDDVVVSRA